MVDIYSKEFMEFVFSKYISGLRRVFPYPVEAKLKMWKAVDEGKLPEMMWRDAWYRAIWLYIALTAPVEGLEWIHEFLKEKAGGMRFESMIPIIFRHNIEGYLSAVRDVASMRLKSEDYREECGKFVKEIEGEVCGLIMDIYSREFIEAVFDKYISDLRKLLPHPVDAKLKMWRVKEKLPEPTWRSEWYKRIWVYIALTAPMDRLEWIYEFLKSKAWRMCLEKTIPVTLRYHLEGYLAAARDVADMRLNSGDYRRECEKFVKDIEEEVFGKQ